MIHSTKPTGKHTGLVSTSVGGLRSKENAAVVSFGYFRKRQFLRGLAKQIGEEMMEQFSKK
jgi:hypothetical protein